MKMLIAEDDAVSRRVLESILTKWGHEVAVTKNGSEAWWELGKDDAPQLAVLDWMMPGMDGIELCREIRRRGSEPYIYILLLTAKGEKMDIVHGIEAGADDYLTKPFDPQELRVRLRAGMRIVELQETLRLQATRDPLTGVWNRRGILDLLQKELNRSRRRQSSLSVIMVDLDHFKSINDRHGHAAGDAVLREAASRMKSTVRAYDFVGRVGGEEFLIFAPECDARSAVDLAERIRISLSQEPISIPSSSLHVTGSFGVAFFNGTETTEVESLIRAADDALYQAKMRGRDRVDTAEIAPACTQ